MSEDPRCCGSGTCITDNEVCCWFGQQWDGQRMFHAPLASDPAPAPELALAAAPEPAVLRRV